MEVIIFIHFAYISLILFYVVNYLHTKLNYFWIIPEPKKYPSPSKLNPSSLYSFILVAVNDWAKHSSGQHKQHTGPLCSAGWCSNSSIVIVDEHRHSLMQIHNTDLFCMTRAFTCELCKLKLVAIIFSSWADFSTFYPEQSSSLYFSGWPLNKWAIVEINTTQWLLKKTFVC